MWRLTSANYVHMSASVSPRYNSASSTLRPHQDLAYIAAVQERRTRRTREYGKQGKQQPQAETGQCRWCTDTGQPIRWTICFRPPSTSESTKPTKRTCKLIARSRSLSDIYDWKYSRRRSSGAVHSYLRSWCGDAVVR